VNDTVVVQTAIIARRKAGRPDVQGGKAPRRDGLTCTRHFCKQFRKVFKDTLFSRKNHLIRPRTPDPVQIVLTKQLIGSSTAKAVFNTLRENLANSRKTHWDRSTEKLFSIASPRVAPECFAPREQH